MTQLPSEQIIIEAPLSFTGVTKRLWRLTHHDNVYIHAVSVVLILWALVIAYCFIACWYCIFGLLLLPYRLLRRSSRKQKRDALRHRELMDTRQ